MGCAHGPDKSLEKTNLLKEQTSGDHVARRTKSNQEKQSREA